MNSIESLKLVTGLRYNAPGNRYGGQLVGTFVAKKERIDQTTAPVPVASPGFAVFDLLGYWNITKQFVLNAGVFNLTDRNYFLWSDLQGVGGGTSPLATNVATLDRFSQPGINARITLKYQF